MYDSDKKWESFIIPRPVALPLVLNKDAKHLENLVTVKRNYAPYGSFTSPYDNKEIFVLFNANLRFSPGTGVQDSSLSIRHEFARDDDGSASYIANLSLDAVNLAMMDGDYLKFSAYLTRMSFYDPSQDNPFTGAVEKDESSDYSVNYGYPYLPPEASIQSFNLPAPVTITVRYITNNEVREWVEESYLN